MTQIDDQAGVSASDDRGEDLEVRVARQPLEQAKAEGASLVGPGGSLAGVTTTVVEAALDAEMADRLGYAKGERPPFADWQSPQTHLAKDSADRGRLDPAGDPA